MCARKCVPRVTVVIVRNVPVRGVTKVTTRCTRRPGLLAMTTSTDLLENLRREWRHVGHGTDARHSFACFAQRHPDLAIDGLADLGDLVGALETRGGRSVLERARIVTALLE